jgi:hypothetical protein
MELVLVFPTNKFKQLFPFQGAIRAKQDIIDFIFRAWKPFFVERGKAESNTE